MKKLTGKQLRLVITFVIVIIFALSYEYIYGHFVDLAGDYTEKTKLVNAQISQRQDELEQEDKILTDTAEMKSQIEEIIDTFPITLTKEENLLFIETMEKDLRMEITPVTITDPSAFHTTKLPIRDENGQEILLSEESPEVTSDPTESGTAIEGTTSTEVNDDSTINNDIATVEPAVTDETTVTEEPAVTDGTEVIEETGQLFMTGLQSSINITFQTTYPKFKKVLEYIKKYPEKTSVSNATLSYDGSTGDLIATMTITRYALTGTGKKYEEPYIGDISIGTDNIFGDPAEVTPKDTIPEGDTATPSN